MTVADGREPVHVVGVQYLNARPLLAGLEAGIAAPFAYTFSTAEPAACAESLAAGSAAAGLVPVAALPHLTRVDALPAYGIASRGAVLSVLLVSRVDPKDVSVLAVHTASRTSVALARLLLAERWGVSPRVVDARPPVEAMLAQADAAVVIGDPALAVAGHTGLREIDLAQAWTEWTGLPFVFAVWGITVTAPDGTAKLLGDSLSYAESNWEKLLPGWATGHGVEPELVRRYLESTLTYRLGAEERQATEEFLARAARGGLLPERRDVFRAA